MKISSPLAFRMKVSIKVVPGEFDDSLFWLYKEKVRVTLLGQQYPLVGNILRVIHFEKGKEPCSRPLHDDHHEYRLILELSERLQITYFGSDLILRIERSN